MASSNDSSFESLIGQLRAKEPSAAAHVFERFAERLIALARGRLSGRLKAKVDPEDVVQSVFKSFFCRHEAGQFQLDDWGELWGLLVTITIRKCGRRAEEFYAARRDVRRELPPESSSDGGTSKVDLPSLDPTPEEATTLTDTLLHVMAALDERGQQVLTLRLQGYSVAEVSDRVGRTERTVNRYLEEMRRRLQFLERTNTTKARLRLVQDGRT